MATASGMDVYEYDVNGITHTAQMTAEDAKRLGAKKAKGALPPEETAPQSKAGPTPENK